MATIEQTAGHIVAASTWDERVARVRQIPQRHGTDEHAAIDAGSGNWPLLRDRAREDAVCHHGVS